MSTSEDGDSEGLAEARNELKQMWDYKYASGERCAGSGCERDAGDCVVRARRARWRSGDRCELQDGCCFAAVEGCVEYVSGLGTALSTANYVGHIRCAEI